MTVKEASEKFRLTETEVRKRKNDGMILGVYKNGRSIVIPDDTKVLPSKREIRLFLFQIIQTKNNKHNIIARDFCQTEEELKIVLEYIYKSGFIGEYEFNEDINECFFNMNLTEKGMAFVIGQTTYNKMLNVDNIKFKFNCDINFNLLKIG